MQRSDMQGRRLKLLADDNIPKSVVIKLRNSGIDIIRASEVKRGMSDEEIVDIAIRDQRIVITFDKDFGKLIIEKRFKIPGLILLKFEPKSKEYVFEKLYSLLGIHMGI